MMEPPYTIRAVGYEPDKPLPSELYHGFVIRMGTAEQGLAGEVVSPETMIDRAIHDLPELIDGYLEPVPQSEGGEIEVFDFYDVDNGELVFVVRAKYRQRGK